MLARLLHLLSPILYSYKWYRKRKGGTWYKIEEPDEGGASSYVERWTNEAGNKNIVAEERY